MTFDEAGRGDIFDTVADRDNRFMVESVTGLFGVESLRSKTRRSKHEVYIRCP